MTDSQWNVSGSFTVADIDRVRNLVLALAPHHDVVPEVCGGEPSHLPLHVGYDAEGERYFMMLTIDQAIEAFKGVMAEDDVRRRWDCMIVEDEADG